MAVFDLPATEKSWCKTPGLMSGYLDCPDLTAAVLRDGWFHTGDRGAVDESGRIWLTGRIKDQRVRFLGFIDSRCDENLAINRLNQRSRRGPIAKLHITGPSCA
jgi:acyl-CoA synthetase (AMP-forming)/AMP-acid ligase II